LPCHPEECRVGRSLRRDEARLGPAVADERWGQETVDGMAVIAKG
jgi:hypothetical protein